MNRTLRNDARKLMVLFCVAILVLMAAGSLLFVWRGVVRFEEAAATASVERSVRALHHETRELDLPTVDWAVWDESYNYIKGKNPGFERRNLNTPTFAYLHVDLVLFVNRTGQMHRGIIFPPMDRTQHSLDAGTLKSLESYGLLGRGKYQLRARSGLVVLPQGAMIVSAQPIRDSEDTKAPNGLLVFGRWIKGSLGSDIAELNGNPVEFYTMDRDRLSDDCKLAIIRLQHNATTTDAVDRDQMAGYAMLSDLSDKRALLLRATYHRTVSRKALASLLSANGAILIVVVIVCAIAMLVLDVKVFSRLKRLSSEVSTITTFDDLSQRTTVDERDELGALGGSINRMLQSLEDGRAETRHTIDTLRATNRCFVGFGPDPEANIASLTELCGNMLGALCTVYNRLEGDEFVVGAAWNAPVVPGQRSPSEGRVCLEVARSSDEYPTVISHIPQSRYALSDPFIGAAGIETYVGQAVRLAGSVYGTLCAAFDNDFQPNETEMELMHLIGSAIATEEMRRQAGERLEAREALFRALFDNSPIGIVVLNEEGIVLTSNRAAQDILGWHDQKVVQSFRLFSDPMLLDSTKERARRGELFHTERKADFEKMRQSGVYSGDRNGIAWVHTTFTPLSASPSVAGGYILLLQDITERKIAEEEIALARQHDAETGRNIQKTLLTAGMPGNVKGVSAYAVSVPSWEVDGDFYDFFPHSDRCFDLVVADVMGKGVPAALMGAAAKNHIIRALALLPQNSTTGHLPAVEDIVGQVHKQLSSDLANLESFVTMVYCRFDLDASRFSFVDCGHMATIHFKAASGDCEFLKGINVPLGCRIEEVYESQTVSFDPGDIFLLYSDGITDSRSDTGEYFTPDRLATAVARMHNSTAKDMVEQVMSELYDFKRPDQVVDDLTCLVVKIG